MESKFIAKKLESNLWEDFEAFFEFQGNCSGCWCMNHRVPMGLDFEGEAAKLAMKQLVKTNRVFGLLAYQKGDSVPIGWLALDRRKTLPGHDCVGDDISCGEEVWSIHCVTSRADMKGMGVEEFLSSCVTEYAKSLGAEKIEAYPEPDSVVGMPFKSWNTFNGYQSQFAELGFQPRDKQPDDGYKIMELNIE